jgi:hypothetical protein
MFKKLAKFHPLETWRIAPGTRVAVHSNDNLPGFRHPAGRRRPRPNQTLACHWYLIDGRLECRWGIEAPDGAPSTILDLNQRRAARSARPWHGCGLLVLGRRRCSAHELTDEKCNGSID